MILIKSYIHRVVKVIHPQQSWTIPTHCWKPGQSLSHSASVLCPQGSVALGCDLCEVSTSVSVPLSHTFGPLPSSLSKLEVCFGDVGNA